MGSDLGQESKKSNWPKIQIKLRFWLKILVNYEPFLNWQKPMRSKVHSKIFFKNRALNFFIKIFVNQFYAKNQ